MLCCVVDIVIPEVLLGGHQNFLKVGIGLVVLFQLREDVFKLGDGLAVQLLVGHWGRELLLGVHILLVHHHLLNVLLLLLRG